jgi:hypothetical protein
MFGACGGAVADIEKLLQQAAPQMPATPSQPTPPPAQQHPEFEYDPYTQQAQMGRHPQDLNNNPLQGDLVVNLNLTWS